MVRYAVERWGSAGGEFDQVWCVSDVDDYRDLDEAVRYAENHGVELVLSNPCFELWLLLHHVDHRKWLAGYPAVKELLRKHVRVPADKSVAFERDFGGERWWRAADRARALAPEGEEHQRNPSTRMWRLAFAISGERPDESEAAEPR
ncbi:RloB family protein [Streptomyces marincola]|uniref:RloB-like protein n=1 Tax=Streptomyces marincola TaxID=2878388 RepID=A0A1W7CZQ8_9ACTN|nr:RloB family protein [Streptomyces marincola]ARQ70294.1 hypothetical protein CAG99_16885 [Streptomyces marincola]